MSRVLVDRQCDKTLKRIFNRMRNEDTDSQHTFNPLLAPADSHHLSGVWARFSGDGAAAGGGAKTDALRVRLRAAGGAGGIGAPGHTEWLLARHRGRFPDEHTDSLRCRATAAAATSLKENAAFPPELPTAP
eukprot:2741323-Prymnesium_polylepis.1